MILELMKVRNRSVYSMLKNPPGIYCSQDFLLLQWGQPGLSCQLTSILWSLMKSTCHLLSKENISQQPLETPSIAVLPFVNMSGDPEQEYFSDGISEDINTDLSRLKNLTVIARNSSFTHKGSTQTKRILGDALKVSHVQAG